MALLLFSFFVLNASSGWLTDFKEAQKIASEKHENILLNFSGSDWCGSCMRLHEEVFGSMAFSKYAELHLVLVNADFPRNKKNQLSKEQVRHNEALAEKYNPMGKFPYTLLLNAKGDILKVWDGVPAVKPDDFVKQLMLMDHAAN